ncbi:hypothetical protein ACVXHB_31290 [Escherichia coli]
MKIAVIGLTTDDTAKLGNPENFTDMSSKPADEAKLVIQELQQTEKPDIIIAATDMGITTMVSTALTHRRCGDGARAACRIAGDDRRWSLARSGLHGGRNKKQVDYVPGTPCKPDQQNGIWIVQAHEGQIRGTG